MPNFMMSIVGHFNPYVKESLEMLYEFDRPFIVDHSDFEQAFGDIATPVDESLRRTIAWYQQYAVVTA